MCFESLLPYKFYRGFDFKGLDMGEILAKEIGSVDKMTVVLASASPRRAQMLEKNGVQFACLVSDCDESAVSESAANDSSIKLDKLPETVATLKAQGAKALLNEDCKIPILASDTIVFLGNKAYGKPKDADDAFRMLSELSGKTHYVTSGVCILLYDDSKIVFSQSTAVTFKQLSDQDIADYIATGEPFDKAGSYGIQGAGSQLVDGIDGDYDTVVGMPLADVLPALDELENSNYEYVHPDKNQVRMLMKSVRKSLDIKKRLDASWKACEILLASEIFARAKTVAAYAPMGSELSFEKLFEDFPADKRLVVPCTMASRRMEFIEIRPDMVEAGKLSMEFLANPSKAVDLPEGLNVVSEDEIDLVLVPGVAFDLDGYRMGYGGGYYDTYLAREDLDADIAGIFYEEQLFHGQLPVESHDRALPWIITQNGIRNFE